MLKINHSLILRFAFSKASQMWAPLIVLVTPFVLLILIFNISFALFSFLIFRSGLSFSFAPLIPWYHTFSPLSSTNLKKSRQFKYFVNFAQIKGGNCLVICAFWQDTGEGNTGHRTVFRDNSFLAAGFRFLRPKKSQTKYSNQKTINKKTHYKNGFPIIF